VIRFGIIPAHGPAHLGDAIEHVRLARDYGLDAIWIEEHHDTGPYWPTPLLAIAALSPHLGGLAIGTAILVLPLHDPVHVAEQGAVLDQLTGGRLVLGLGMGDSAEEFAAFRVPVSRRGARFEEQVAIIRGLWSGETLTYHGQFYELEGVRLKTPPVQPGGPPLWIGGWGPRALARAAAIGDAWLPGPVGTFGDIVGRQATYDGHVRERGEDPLTRPRPLIRDVVVAESEDDAWELASGTVLAAYRETYVESDHVLIGRETSGPAIADPRDLAADRLVIGDPQQVAAQLARCLLTLECTELVVRLKLPGLEPAQMTTMLHLLGERVVPELRRAGAARDSLAELAAR
jgi:alkanesulfonate monooxygenase SsuD/methylene tetrahydromethanopterin reductase-like flavin-dependent oxidoreductase (luciferase family)